MQSKFNPNIKLEKDVFVLTILSLSKRENQNRLLFVIEGCEQDMLTFNLQLYYREYMVSHGIEKNNDTNLLIDTITIMKQEQDYPSSIIQGMQSMSFNVTLRAAKQVATMIDDEISIFKEAERSKSEITGLNPSAKKYDLPEEVSKKLAEWCSDKLALAEVPTVPAENVEQSKGCCILA